MGLKLTIGKLRDAWYDYPRARREITKMTPGPPIFVTGTHRSGTTWFARMLAVPGLWYVHEPFSPYHRGWHEPFTYVASDANNDAVEQHMQRVLNGGFRAAANVPSTDHPLMPLRLFKPPIRRVMVKDPLACLLTDYLTRKFDLQTLVLFRHPCGFASSVCRLGWPRAGFLRQFLACQPLMDEHLAAYASLLEAHSGEDDLESAAVLHGALNTVLWAFVRKQVGQWLLFEDLCQQPIEAFAEIFGELQLPYDEDVRAMHEGLCFSGTQRVGTYRTHAVQRNSLEMARAWQRQLQGDEIARIRNIWEQFDVPLYRSESDWHLGAAPLTSREAQGG